MGNPEGSSDESIGRPADWREGRYQQPGKAVDESVVEPVQRDQPPPEPPSKPVTRKDYEDLTPPAGKTPSPVRED